LSRSTRTTSEEPLGGTTATVRGLGSTPLTSDTSLLLLGTRLLRVARRVLEYLCRHLSILSGVYTNKQGTVLQFSEDSNTGKQGSDNDRCRHEPRHTGKCTRFYPTSRQWTRSAAERGVISSHAPELQRPSAMLRIRRRLKAREVIGAIRDERAQTSQ